MREKIKNTILEIAKREGIKIDKIILFGSRARGDASEDSDWDVLIVVEEMERKARWEFAKKVRLKLAKEFIDVDVIVQELNDFKKRKNFLSTISREADERGIVL